MIRSSGEAFVQHLSYVMEELPKLSKRSKAIYKFTPVYLCPESRLVEVLGKSYSDATCVCHCRICKKKDWNTGRHIIEVSVVDYDVWKAHLADRAVEALYNS